MIACENGHLSVVRMLVDKLANIGVTNKVIQPSVVIDLVATYSVLTYNLCMQKGHSCLMAACQNGHLKIVELLLSVPQVDVNAKDQVTLIHYFSV